MENPEKGLWRESADVFHRNLKPCLAYIGAMLAIAVAAELFKSSSPSIIAQSFAAALLAIPAHLTVLKNKAGFDALNSPESSKAIMSFVFRGIGLGVISFIPFILTLIFLLSLGMTVWEAVPRSSLLLLLCASWIFAKWGTMLPAIIAQDDKSIARSGIRGSMVKGYAFPRLLLAFGILSTIQLGIFLALASLSNGDGNYFPDTGGFDFVLIAASIISGILGAFQIVMIAVILSRSYLRAEGKTAVA